MDEQSLLFPEASGESWKCTSTFDRKTSAVDCLLLCHIGRIKPMKFIQKDVVNTLVNKARNYDVNES